MLVEQTNVYYQQHLDRQAGPSRWLPGITLPDMMTFVALALQMRHELKEILHDYWSRLKTTTQSVLRRDHDTRQSFTHNAFSAFSQRPGKGEEYNRLWKLRTVFDKLNEAYAKFYNPSEHLAVDEVILKFKGRVIFWQYIPK